LELESAGRGDVRLGLEIRLQQGLSDIKPGPRSQAMGPVGVGAGTCAGLAGQAGQFRSGKQRRTLKIERWYRRLPGPALGWPDEFV
jgi:hypothetical protein